MGELRVGKKKLHPIGLQEVIVGDLREREHPVTHEIVQLKGTGQSVYRLNDRLENPWFIVAYESGDRVIHSNK